MIDDEDTVSIKVTPVGWKFDRKKTVRISPTTSVTPLAEVFDDDTPGSRISDDSVPDQHVDVVETMEQVDHLIGLAHAAALPKKAETRSPKEWRRYVREELDQQSDDHELTITLGDLRRVLGLSDQTPCAIFLTKPEVNPSGAITKGERRVMVHVPADTCYTTSRHERAEEDGGPYTIFHLDKMSLTVVETPEVIDASVSVARRIHAKVTKRKKKG